ncbi:MAG: type I restriction endonuclease [Thermoguttaceae bacterium]
MPNLLEEIRTFASKIDAYRSSCLNNESNTKGSLIEPILKTLGWDTGDPNVVDREFKNDNTKSNPVDYALKIHREAKLLVEAKSLGTDLYDRQWIEQIVKYAATAGVQWGILTNGDKWLFVKCLEQGDVTKRVFREISVSKDSPEIVASTLRYISYEHWQENDLEILWKIGVVDKDVSEVVTNIFRNRDKSLAQLITKRLEKHSLKDVADSLARLDVTIKAPDLTLLNKDGHLNRKSPDDTIRSKKERSPKPRPAIALATNIADTPVSSGELINLTLADSWKFTRPVSYSHPFSGEIIIPETRLWKTVYTELCRILYKKDPQLFRSLLTHRSFARTFKRCDDELFAPKHVVSDIYAETNMSADGMRIQFRKLSSVFSKYSPVFKFAVEKK